MQLDNFDNKIRQIQGLFESKKYKEALKRLNKLILSNPTNEDLLNFKSIILLNLEDFFGAENCIKNALLINKNNPISLCNYGNIFLKKENYLEAEKYYKKSIEIQQNNLNTILNLANCYFLNSKNLLSIELLKKCILINPNIEICHQLLASNYRELHQFNLHEEHLQVAAKINPLNFENFFHLAFYYQSIGNFQEASSFYLMSIKLNEYHGQSHYNYWQINKFQMDQNNLNKIESLGNKSIDQESRAFFNLILAEYHLKNNSNNFIHYLRKANKIKSQLHPFKKTELKFEFDRIKSRYLYIKNSLNEVLYKNDDIRPIFIIGLPRSGSSVVEQIISNVENIYACGEVDNLYKQLHNFIQIDNLSFDETIHYLKNIRNSYISHISNISNSKIFTDKLPLNFKYIGFLKIIFPNAKFILTKRNNFDNFFSIYRNFFLGSANSFANSISDILYFSNFYNDLIEFWANDEIKFYTHNYSDYCEDKKNSTYSLFEFLEIKFDPKYLDLSTNRPVLTASNSKIRDNNVTNDYEWLRQYIPEFI